MTSDPVARRFVEITVSDFGGNPENMWGAANDPLWAANDPYVNAEKLRGDHPLHLQWQRLPGPYDTLDARTVGGDRRNLATQVVVGGVIEAVTNDCTIRLAEKLRALDIPATVDLRPVGTHSWGVLARRPVRILADDGGRDRGLTSRPANRRGAREWV